VSIAITATQRDALYDEVLTHLSGIDGLWLAIEREDFVTADRLGREFADDLTLVLEDLGWGDESTDASHAVELTTEVGVLRRVLPQLRARAARHLHTEDQAIRKLRSERSRAQLVMDTCDEVLTAVGEGSPA
jgi:hypothetical protein